MPYNPKPLLRSGNAKSKAPNPKQAPMTKTQMFKTINVFGF